MKSMMINRRSPLTDDAIRSVAPSVFQEGNAQRVSSRYVHVPTNGIVSRLRDAGWIPVHAEQQKVRSEDRFGFQKHAVHFHRAEDTQIVKEHSIEMMLVNSHDGASAYVLHAAVWRRICSNGLVVSDGGFEALRFRHANLDPQEVVEGSMQLIEQMPVLAEKIERMKQHILTGPQQLDFAKRVLALRFDDTPPILECDALRTLRPDDAGSDVWRVMNRVQEAVIKGGQRYHDAELRRRRVAPLRGIDVRISINKSIW